MTVKNEYYDLAKDLDQFMKEFDPYEYADSVDNSESHVKSLELDLKQGKFSDIVNTLQEIIDEVVKVDEAMSLLDRMKRLPSYLDEKRDLNFTKTEIVAMENETDIRVYSEKQLLKSFLMEFDEEELYLLLEDIILNKRDYLTEIKALSTVHEIKVDNETLFAFDSSCEFDSYIQNMGLNNEKMSINIVSKLKVEVNNLNEPFLFNENEYYYAYEIYYDDNLIASGQDSIEYSDDISDEVIANHVMDQIGYYVSKPNIHECGKVMQDCYKTCIESDSGMCFLEAEFMDDYTSEDIKAFLEDIEKFNLNNLSIIENYDSVEDAKKLGEAFAICYGSLGDFFNNVSLDEQEKTNEIKQLLKDMRLKEDREEITTLIDNGIEVDMAI